ncbi:prepilin peptidase [Candidatus Woesearchaeota archaeon]|nr:prepilin peptidase [Candidatus Woesearchaeota archaeon]
MFEIELILILLAFIVTIIAVISDIKTTEVPDYANYFLIFSAVSLRVLYSLAAKDWSFTLAILYSSPIIFILASTMYYLKQWGGGDAKLLISLSLALATYPSFFLNFFSPKNIFAFPITIFTNILIIGAVYSLVYASFIAFRNRKKFSKPFYEILRNKFKLQASIITIIIFIAIILTITGIPKVIIFMISISPIVFFYIYIFIKTVEVTCLIKRIPISKLMEGDLILENIVYKNKIIHKKNQDLTRKQLNLIKMANIETVRIKQGIIFTPAFLISLIISLIFGNLFLYLI